jgi:small subunit ribosomal protein S16
MDEPKEGATTLKKKAQDKLAAKANPVVSESTEDNAVSEVPAEVVTTEEVVVSEPVEEIAVSEVPAEVVTTEEVVVSEVVAETLAVEEAVVETPEAAAE